MSYFCRQHGAYHAQFINEQRDLTYLNGIQRNGSLLNMNRNNYLSTQRQRHRQTHLQQVPQQAHLQHSPSHIQQAQPHIQHSPSHIQQSPSHIQHSPSHIQKAQPHLQHSPSHIQQVQPHFQQQAQQTYYNSNTKDNFLYKSYNNVNAFYQNQNLYQMPNDTLYQSNDLYPSPQDVYQVQAQIPTNIRPPPQKSSTKNTLRQDVYYKSHKQINKLNSPSNKLHKVQKLFIARHGERVDTTFGHAWLQNAFINGEYNRFNLNMPKSLPKRENLNEYIFDPPLTEIGMYQAKLHGEELARKGIKLSYMYASPALRSIQTADKILEGMSLKDTVPIRVETGLFELLSWQSFLPKKYPFLSHDSLIKTGFNIDKTYTPVVPFQALNITENESQYYKRSHYMTQKIVDKHSVDGEHIMFVGHAPTIEGCSRQLIGQKPRTTEDFVRINMKVPFLSILELEKNCTTNVWSMNSPTIAAMKHTELSEFDWNEVKPQIITNTNPKIYQRYY